MNTVIYSRVSSESQDNGRQITNLKKIAEEKGWHIKRTFQEKVSGTLNARSRNEFKSLIEYINKSSVNIVMVSEISRVGRKVVDVLNIVEYLHERQIALYIQQFNMLTFENSQENPIAKMLLQMLSIGAEMENNQRKIRQREGIKLAQIKGKYIGRHKGAKTKPTVLLMKYQDISDLINKSELSLRRISQISGRSINTVRKIKRMIA
jgi:DNA invertase Pin-like site-specific DNA recombinase